MDKSICRFCGREEIAPSNGGDRQAQQEDIGHHYFERGGGEHQERREPRY